MVGKLGKMKKWWGSFMNQSEGKIGKNGKMEKIVEKFWESQLRGNREKWEDLGIKIRQSSGK